MKEFANSSDFMKKNLKVLDAVLKKPPAILNNDDPHISCAVALKIGSRRVRVLLDTGAVRSMMDKEVARMLREDDPGTKEACMDPQPLSTPMNCEGAQKHTVIGTVEWTMMVRIGVEEPKDAKTPAQKSQPVSPGLTGHRSNIPYHKYLDAKFFLMENLSDPIILGRPELQSLGLYLEQVPDEQGNLWVHFSAFNQRLPIIMPGGKRTNIIRVDEPRMVQGPDVQEIPVVMSEADYRYHVQ